MDFRLYLPKNWFSDPVRCSASGVPLDYRVFKTKAELALELIKEAVKAKIKFSHINMDGFYGSQPWLLTCLEQMGLIYVADISSADRVISEEPDYGVPSKRGIKGRNPFRIKILNTIPIRVDELVKRIERWQVIRIREFMGGFLEVKFVAIKVWRMDKDKPNPLPVWLLIRKELDDSDIKYSLCNANHIYSWPRLLRMQSQRYWIERSFEDAIDLAGMAEYQVRNWNAWHHHMALVLLALFWITKELKHFVSIKKRITLQDTVKILKLKFPLKIQTSLSISIIIEQNLMNRKESRKCRMKKKGRPIIY